MVICLERDADLHMAQLMPLPLTVSCFTKIQIGFTFLVPAHPGSAGPRAVKCVCVCVCVHHLARPAAESRSISSASVSCLFIFNDSMVLLPVGDPSFHLYTGWAKKTGPQTHDHNSVIS